MSTTLASWVAPLADLGMTMVGRRDDVVATMLYNTAMRDELLPRSSITSRSSATK